MKKEEHLIIDRVPSRGTQVDPFKCTETTGGDQFELIILAAYRARQISRERVANRGAGGSAVQALLEIQAGEFQNFIHSKGQTNK